MPYCARPVQRVNLTSRSADGIPDKLRDPLVGYAQQGARIANRKARFDKPLRCISGELGGCLLRLGRL
jgi:hypothetical protein